jgi:integrase/recombinase XerD
MNEASLEAVKEYVRRRKYKSEWLFPSSKAQAHKPITDRTVRNIVYLYSKKLGLSNMSPHKFRHSCATHMHQSGMDIRIIQEMLGHADISTTTIYTKVGIESLSKSYHEHHPRG